MTCPFGCFHCNAVFILGTSSNTQSHIIKYSWRQSYNVTKVSTPLHCNRMEPFWISWEENTLKVGAGHFVGQDVILYLNDSVRARAKYLAVSTGYGASGHWIFHGGM